MTVTNPQRQLHSKPRTLAEALIDGLGPDPLNRPIPHGWTRYISRIRDDLRAVHIHLDGRIRVYDAAGKLEQEYET